LGCVDGSIARCRKGIETVLDQKTAAAHTSTPKAERNEFLVGRYRLLYEQRRTATAEWQARLDELELAFAQADDLGRRVAALRAPDPARELPPDTRPKPRPKAAFIRQVY
jgi:hypothetical protein